MAISYPILLPLWPAPRSFQQTETSFAAMTSSPWTGSQQVQLNQGQIWGFSVEYPPMNDAQARAWSGVLAQLNGRYGTFLFGDPKWKSPLGSWAGAPVVDGPGQAGQTLAMRGFDVGATGKAGDYFQHGADADARLYKVTQDFTADGAGEAQVEIWPRLRISPQDGDALTLVSPRGVFRLVSPTVSRSWEPFRHGLAFDMIEAL